MYLCLPPQAHKHSYDACLFYVVLRKEPEPHLGRLADVSWAFCSASNAKLSLVSLWTLLLLDTLLISTLRQSRTDMCKHCVPSALETGAEGTEVVG